MTPSDLPPVLPSAAALLNLDIPERCLPGVKANLEALAEHLRRIEQFEIPEPKA